MWWIQNDSLDYPYRRPSSPAFRWLLWPWEVVLMTETSTNWRCPHAFGHSDDARRCADNVNYWYQVEGWQAVGKWVAVKLADGSSDHALYDSKSDAVRHQSNEFLCTYIKLVPGQMGICESQIFLEFTRNAYDNGFRMADPDHRGGGKQLIMRGRPVETVAAQFKAMRRNLGIGK